MGAGIAQVSVDKGMRTILKDVNWTGLSRGIDQVRQTFHKGILQVAAVR